MHFQEDQQGIGARARENQLGDVCSGFDRSLLANSLQRSFNAVWPEYRGGCKTRDWLES